MIPRAKQTNEIFGNPLRNRVTACRKRLRDNRGSHRIPPEADSTEADVTKLAQFHADSSAMRQLVNLDFGPAFGEAEAGDLSESIGQEVGIT